MCSSSHVSSASSPSRTPASWPDNHLNHGLRIIRSSNRASSVPPGSSRGERERGGRRFGHRPRGLDAKPHAGRGGEGARRPHMPRDKLWDAAVQKLFLTQKAPRREADTVRTVKKLRRQEAVFQVCKSSNFPGETHAQGPGPESESLERKTPRKPRAREGNASREAKHGSRHRHLKIGPCIVGGRTYELLSSRENFTSGEGGTYECCAERRTGPPATRLFGSSPAVKSRCDLSYLKASRL